MKSHCDSGSILQTTRLKILFRINLANIERATENRDIPRQLTQIFLLQFFFLQILHYGILTVLRNLTSPPYNFVSVTNILAPYLYTSDGISSFTGNLHEEIYLVESSLAKRICLLLQDFMKWLHHLRIYQQQMVFLKQTKCCFHWCKISDKSDRSASPCKESTDVPLFSLGP